MTEQEQGIPHTTHDVSGVSVCFVCDCGHLEAQAVLLAASLRAQHPDLSLIAAVPGQPAAATCAALDALGVSRVAIVNPVADDYPIGHKVAALGAGDAHGVRVFLDTDTLCLRPLDWSVLRAHSFASKPADVATFGDTATWQRLYQRFGLPLPTRRVAASVSGRLMLPYFNAGMMATAHAGELAAEWARICRAIDAMDDINPRRPWLDQIALPIAVARLGLTFRSLDEAWNYPVHLKPLSGGPMIVHYHQPDKVAREPALTAAVARLLEQHAGIAPVLEADALWAPVLAAVRRQQTVAPSARRWPWQRGRQGVSAAGTQAPPRHHRDLIISGIPRSGTSYLCRCLDSFDNVAVINEPQALFHGLPLSPEPWAVPMLHTDLRRRIDAGEAVDNKTDARGRLTEDTAVEESITAYRPQLRDAHWLLASKNTLAYMARLEGILRLMPEARVVACIRHPLDTLASWKGTFAHLAAGDPVHVPVGGLADPFLPAHLRDGLQSLAAWPAAGFRRAAWWRLLAQELMRHGERIVVVRYEDLVADPAGQMQRVLGPLGAAAGTPLAPMRPSGVRTARRQTLDAADYEAVACLCGDLAESFGYDIDADS